MNQEFSPLVPEDAMSCMVEYNIKDNANIQVKYLNAGPGTMIVNRYEKGTSTATCWEK